MADVKRARNNEHAQVMMKVRAIKPRVFGVLRHPFPPQFADTAEKKDTVPAIQYSINSWTLLRIATGKLS